MPEETTIDSGATQPTGDTAATTEEAATPAAEGLPGGEEEASEAGDTGLPGEETSEETETKEPVGAPEAYSEFDLKDGEDIGYAISDEQKEALTAFGKENNLTDKQMQGIVAFDIARAKEKSVSDDKFVSDFKNDGIKASRKEHGEKYAGMFNKNKATYEKVFDEAFRKELNKYGISSQAGFFNGMNVITNMISEDRTVPGDGGGQTTFSKYSDILPQTNVHKSTKS